MRKVILVVIVVITLILGTSAATTVVPTTTLARETGNNTSAADTFKTQSSANLGAGNISKVPMRSLLYAGSTTKLYVHLMGWFGGTNHMNVGYTSNDATQVAKQVDDMMGRGIDGAILDWYGQNNTRPNQVAQMLRAEAEKRGGQFQFAIMEDVGALKTCAATSGCDLSGQAIIDLTYAYNNFETSSTYVRYNGRPVVFFFGMEAYTLDWTRIRAGVPGNPIFIFRNSGAFSKSYSDGGFSWLGISSTDPNSMGLSYMDNFYSTALSYPSKLTYGSGYKGFNDTLASWGSNRIVNQHCGQTWLATMAEAGKYYSSSKQLPNAQIVTWNDYEEGSELESGVDNCVTVSGAVTGNTLNWGISGNENTLDHYTVFISTDGQNLMSLADVAAGTNTLDLTQFSLDQANYTLFVKAVGKSSIKNQISGAINYAIAGQPNQPPVAALAVTPASGISSLTATAATAGSSDPDGKIVSTTIDFGDGFVANASSAKHLYSSVGNYMVKATVTDDKGATNSASASVTVIANQPPQARLSILPGNGVAPITVNASTAASTDADGTIQSSSIDFGDGSVATGGTATHTYASVGTFTVTGSVTDDMGATSKATATVSVVANQPPVPVLSVTPTSGMAPVSFSASTSASTDADGTVASSTINWGDGATSAGPTATHVYATAGKYTVTATVTDDRGAMSIASSAVTVNYGVTVLAPTDGATVASQLRVAANVSSSAAVTAIRIYLDGTSVYLAQNVSSIDTTIAASAGLHRITVQSWDAKGLVQKSTVSVTLPNQPPTASLSVTPQNSTVGSTVTASTAGSEDADGSIASSTINWGDGTTSAGPSATHVFATAGSFAVTTTVTDNLGATANASAAVTASPKANVPPFAALTLNTTTIVAPGTLTASTLSSTDADGSIASSVINWGDGTTSAGPTASHTYNTAGSYTVSTTVNDNQGAKSTTSATVTVVAGVTILQPTNNAIVTGSGRIAATASSNVAIRAIRIYVDSVSVFLANNVSSINTLVTMTKGTHRVTVQSWDKNGIVSKAAISVNVQ